MGAVPHGDHNFFEREDRARRLRAKAERRQAEDREPSDENADATSDR
jgi:hypothetical protein